MSGSPAKLPALHGVRVLDLTQMLAGPLAACRLGDLGGDVIKVENPESGEFNRTHGLRGAEINGEMTTYLSVNRNKRSIALDLKTSSGQAVFAELVKTADVVIQNFRPQTSKKLGLTWSRLYDINPRVILCSISGFGPEGPYSERPGQDLLVQGFSGSMFSVGSDSDPPIPGALLSGDVMTAYQAVIAIMAALVAREKTNIGQVVEVNMFNTVLDAQLQELFTIANTGVRFERTAERTANSILPAPYGVYQAADGWICLAMSPLPLLGELLDNDWLRTLTEYEDGHTQKDDVYSLIRGAFVKKSVDYWIKEADKLGIWIGPVLDYDAVLADKHVRETSLFVEQPIAGGGFVRTVRPPITMSGSTVGVFRSAPRLGEDTEEILEEIGLKGKLKTLLDDAVVRVMGR